MSANPMDLAYSNEACIANANCLGRMLALSDAGAVSNSGGPAAGAPKTTIRPSTCLIKVTS